MRRNPGDRYAKLRFNATAQTRNQGQSNRDIAMKRIDGAKRKRESKGNMYGRPTGSGAKPQPGMPSPSKPVGPGGPAQPRSTPNTGGQIRPMPVTPPRKTLPGKTSDPSVYQRKIHEQMRRDEASQLGKKNPVGKKNPGIVGKYDGENIAERKKMIEMLKNRHATRRMNREGSIGNIVRRRGDVSRYHKYNRGLSNNR